MKHFLLTLAIFLGVSFIQPAWAFLSVEEIKATEKDSSGKAELHLLLTGIRAPTENLHIETDRAIFDFAWSWDRPEADLWLSLGEWKRLTLVLTYVDGSHDSVTLGVWDQTAVTPTK